MNIRDPHSSRQPNDPAIRHIDFDLTADFAQHILQGSVILHFDQPLSDSIRLDTRQLSIQHISAEGHATLQGSLSDETFLGKVLTITGTQGLSKIKIEYCTSPEAAALQWLEPAQTAGKTHPYMFSQCQSILARSVFPCQDSPGVRFTYDATLRIPRALSVVMAAGFVDRQETADQAVFRFHMRHPIPSYLFALAVGNIASQPIGKISKVFAEPETLPSAAWEFADVDGMIESAKHLFGDYIWDRFDLLVMPPSFPFGGMENPMLTFLTPTLIAGDRSLVSVVAHELAHSWTGNLVTNATWEDFWLNEGWTVYAERRIVEKMDGLDMANLQAVNGYNDLLTAFRTFGDKSPLTKLKTDLQGLDPDDVFSTVPYEKGFALLVAIERAIGRDKFDAFIRRYIDHFRFTSITTQQFVDYLKQELPEALTLVDMRPWLDEPELPSSAPSFKSDLIEQVHAVRAKWDRGERTLKTDMKNWCVDQKVLFLDELHRPQSEANCRMLEESFEVGTTNNCEILLPFYSLAISSSYRPVYPAIRHFLGSVGRGKYLKPLYRALHENPETRALAREWFEKFKARYHSMGRNAVQHILDK